MWNCVCVPTTTLPQMKHSSTVLSLFLLSSSPLRKPPKSSSPRHHIRQAVFIDECRLPETEPDDDHHHHQLHHRRTHAPNLKVNFLDASLALLSLRLGIRRSIRYIIREYKKSRTSQRLAVDLIPSFLVQPRPMAQEEGTDENDIAAHSSLSVG